MELVLSGWIRRDVMENWEYLTKEDLKIHQM